MARFCPNCGCKLPENGYYDYNHDNVTYTCEDCGEETTQPIESEYEIGNKVYWNDPCQDPSEDDAMYEARCSVEHTITDVLYCDGCIVEDIVYELDNGTEVYGHELELA